MAATWMPVSPALSAVSATSISNLSQLSNSSASTTGTRAYVPPAMRKQRNIAKFELDIARTENELADERVRAAKHQGPKLPYYKLPFCLNKTQLNNLTGRFPRTTFRCVSDIMHDHPLAHAETMIGMDRLLRMIPAGHRVIDLFGSPGKADEFNRSQAKSNNPKSMIAYCACMTEKDFLRALKFGPALDQAGNIRYVRSHTGDVCADFDPSPRGVDPAFGVTDTSKLTYVLKHTIYYLSDDQIASLLQPTGSRMLALVHRHMGQQGELFDGECTFGKVGDTVEQVNTLTGERYVHRDMSWLWDSKSKVVRTSSGAFVWTFHMISQETWVVELTGCPVGLDERMQSRTKAIGFNAAAHEINEQSLVPTRFPHPSLGSLPGAACVMVGGVPVVSFRGSQLPPVRVTCPELIEFLRLAQAGKPRDGERLGDLFSLARSHVANASDFPGKRNFKVSAAEMAGHVALAWVADLRREDELLLSLQSFQNLAERHSALLSGEAIVVPDLSEAAFTGKTALKVLKRANEVRKQSDVVSGFIAALE